MSLRARLALEVRAKGLRASGVADRIRKRLHRNSYWRGLAARYPLNGVTRTQLAALIAKEMQRVHRESSVVPLPGLDIRGGRCFYGGHALSRVSTDLANGFQVLRIGGIPGDVDALLRAGLAVQTRAASSAAAGRALIVSPHRDDASLSLGGLMVARAQQEAHMVCNVFTVSSWLGNDFYPTPMRAVSMLRAAEELLSLQILGATGVGLGLWEADIRNFHRDATENYSLRDDIIFEGDPNLRSLGERDTVEHGLAQLMERLAPTRVYFPLGLGSHIDHVFLRDVGIARVPGIRRAYPGCQIYFYEDLPYATYEHIEVAPLVAPDSMGGLTLLPEYVDITDHFEAKIQAIAAHRSQFSRAENEDRLHAYANALATEAGFADTHLAERIWRVQT